MRHEMALKRKLWGLRPNGCANCIWDQMSISCDASIEKNMQGVRIWLPINIKEFFVSLGNLY